MAVAPANGGLQHGRQAIEANAERHLEASHRGGLHIVERYL